MASPVQHVATKLVDEPWFVDGRAILTRDGVQVATVISIDDVRLEHRTSEDPETWEIVYDEDVFSSLQTIDDGTFDDTMLGGILAADPDDDPAPGSGYMLLVICTIEFTAAYGGHQAGKVFRRPWKIPASALTAPAD